MDSKKLIVGSAALLALAALYLYEAPKFHSAAAVRQSEQHDVVSTQSSSIAQNLKPRKVTKLDKQRVPASKNQKKVRFNLQSLVKLNPALQAANPDIDLRRLSPDDPRWANVKLPTDIPLVVFKDGLCGRHSVSAMGALSDDKLATTFEASQVPSFISYKTDKTQTIGELESDVSKNDCVLGVFANGPIDSVRLPTGLKNLDAYLAPGTENPPKLYNAKDVAMAGKAEFEKSVAAGDPSPYQIYMAGSTSERFGITPPDDATQPVDSGVTMMGGAGEIWMLPFPQDASPSEQVADLNNAILNAVAHGAHSVLVPAVDPNLLLPATQLAAQYGVSVYEVPRDAAALPTGLIDKQPVRMPSSTAYVPPTASGQ